LKRDENNASKESNRKIKSDVKFVSPSISKENKAFESFYASGKRKFGKFISLVLIMIAVVGMMNNQKLITLNILDTQLTQNFLRMNGENYALFPPINFKIENMLFKRQQLELLLSNFDIYANSSASSNMMTESIKKFCGLKNIFENSSKEVEIQKLNLIMRKSLRESDFIICDSLNENKNPLNYKFNARFSRLKEIEENFGNNHKIMQQKQQEKIKKDISNHTTTMSIKKIDVTTTDASQQLKQPEEKSVNPSTYGRTDSDVIIDDGYWNHPGEDTPDHTTTNLPRDGIT
jgi:hypothetical protein